MKSLKIKTKQITLGQALKLANIAGSGGEGKLLIKAGKIDVNGKVELRRGRKLNHDDIITDLQNQESFIIKEE